MEAYLDRITIRQDQMGGVPCICGLRIPVRTIVGMAANGMTFKKILDAYPDLEEEDLHAVLRYSAANIQRRLGNDDGLAGVGMEK
jgi:uncharacterized protein (DUF433 family)